jgi:mannose-6-phosphate isomerase class I
MAEVDFKRPYLVIPKLIEQPTWGGDYIIKSKHWDARSELSGKKIGQSYELFSGSNLSLLTSSEDADFVGELTDRDAVQIATTPAHSIALIQLIEQSPQDVFGNARAAKAGQFDLLIKFTQSLGNSFQIHIKDGLKHPRWKPKPESWYYLEPGLITLGAKSDVDWQAYQEAVTAVDEGIKLLESQVKSGDTTYEAVQPAIKELIKRYNPWQFVNKLLVKKGALVDLSAGGLHHSWEEDKEKLPLGNVLYELQLEAMDDVSTIRCFDKGKMSTSGGIRPLNIFDYFELIDRSPEANDPTSHIGAPQGLIKTDTYSLDRLLTSKYYVLNQLTLTKVESSFNENITQFRHLFVKNGKIEVITETYRLIVAEGHSVFVPAGAVSYTVKARIAGTQVLVSY